MAVRPSFTWARILGNFFVLFVLLVIGFIYYATVFIAYEAPWEDLCSLSFLVVFHFLCFMLLWCFVQAMVTDPGQVPKYWGFLMGDNEQKRRRYCLMCHVFKPERCHHCSACNRCVLNMDHHCPWINNCVGFYNHKHFILLLFYVLACTYLINVGVFSSAEGALQQLSTEGLWHRPLALLLAYSLNLVLSVVLSFFSKFHVKMILLNKTTIEMLDKKNLHKGNFNCGLLVNWMQVFGRNPWLWGLPLTGKSGKPLGDGVIWRQPESLVVEAEGQGEHADGRIMSVVHNDPTSSEVLQPRLVQATNTPQTKVPFNSPVPSNLKAQGPSTKPGQVGS
jgi:palmitoyltransferase